MMLIRSVSVKIKVDMGATLHMLGCAKDCGTTMKRKGKPTPGRGPTALKEALALRKWTQVSIAAKLKVSKTTVSRWISGERVPSRTHMAALRDVLEIPTDAWV